MWYGRTLSEIASTIVFSLLVMAQAGCTDLDLEQPVIVGSVQQAATVHISPISVDRWEDYISTLQPQFTMTPDLALSLALPQTTVSQAAVAEIQTATGQVSAQPPGIGGASGPSSSGADASKNSSSASSAGGSTAQSSPGSGSGSGGTSSQSSSGGSGQPVSSSATIPNAASLSVPTGKVAFDPILTYHAATAISEEVALLNRYVKDAALRFGYVPYLARIQVSVAPLAHNEPYDVYVDLGTFATCNANPGGQEFPAIAIPLLVTDDVETGQTTNASSVARQLALALSGIADDIAFQGNFSDLKNKFASILGTDYNSLFMVTRGGDNVLQVRLGAARSPNLDVKYSMQTQTHYVSFLLLVDDRLFAGDANCFAYPYQPSSPHTLQQYAPSIRVLGYTRVRNAITGEELPINTKYGKDKFSTIAARFGVNCDRVNCDSAQSVLLGYIASGSYGEFQNYAKSEFSVKFPEALWTALTTLVSQSEYSTTSFVLPKKEVPAVDQRQAIFLHDNCKDTASAVIAGFGDLTPGQFSAVLDLGGGIEIAATTITQAGVGAPFTLQFPSLGLLRPYVGEALRGCPKPNNAAKGVKAKGTAPAQAPDPVKLVGATLALVETTDTRWINGPSPVGNAVADTPRQYAFDAVYLDGSVQTDTSVTLIAANDTIMMDQTGAGSIRVLIKPGKDLQDVVVNVLGATSAAGTVAPTVGTLASAPNGGMKITPVAPAADSTAVPMIILDLQLSGLAPGRAVTLSAAGEAKKPTTGGTAAPGATAAVAVPVIAPMQPAKTGTAAQ